MNTSWMQHAACVGTGPGLWDGPDGEARDEMEDREARALAICRTCSVRQPCLEDALAQPSQQGVRGGVGQVRRAALRNAWLKRQKRARRAA